MIQANELRIGNGYSVGGFIYSLSLIDLIGYLDEAQADKGIIYGIYPIPLTPEILEKCGFKKHRGKYRIVVGGTIYEFTIREHFDEKNGNCGIMGVSFDDDGYSWNCFAWHIKYLHQLQNLYHALTGTELNYQP